MKIRSLNIKNFKSIRHMEIDDVENCLILVGKNNTGKTVVLDAIRAMAGNYHVKEMDFNQKKQNIIFHVTLEITNDDLHQFHNYGRVSNLKNYKNWMKDFQKKLPSFKDGMLEFSCIINQKGTVRYEDGFKKHNPYLIEILPKIYWIDTARNIRNFQEDFFIWGQSEEMTRLRNNICIICCDDCFKLIVRFSRNVELSS